MMPIVMQIPIFAVACLVMWFLISTVIWNLADDVQYTKCTEIGKFGGVALYWPNGLDDPEMLAQWRTVLPQLVGAFDRVGSTFGFWSIGEFIQAVNETDIYVGCGPGDQRSDRYWISVQAASPWDSTLCFEWMLLAYDQIHEEHGIDFWTPKHEEMIAAVNMWTKGMWENMQTNVATS